MKIKMILFDLDGTLLPMDQDVFVKYYFSLLAKKLAPYGYETQKLLETVWTGTVAMMKNDGSCTNEEAFWKKFVANYGEQANVHRPIIEEFYQNEFQKAKVSCGYNPEAANTIYKLKDMGYRVVLATNPLFPVQATRSRIQWAGLSPEDFELYTTYEDYHFCKPNLAYYKEILEKVNVSPEECLMVGNDVTEDMVAQMLGMKVFLLTDCVINKENKDISVYAHGSFEELIDFVRRLP